MNNLSISDPAIRTQGNVLLEFCRIYSKVAEQFTKSSIANNNQILELTHRYHEVTHLMSGCLTEKGWKQLCLVSLSAAIFAGSLFAGATPLAQMTGFVGKDLLPQTSPFWLRNTELNSNKAQSEHQLLSSEISVKLNNKGSLENQTKDLQQILNSLLELFRFRT